MLLHFVATFAGHFETQLHSQTTCLDLIRLFVVVLTCLLIQNNDTGDNGEGDTNSHLRILHPGYNHDLGDGCFLIKRPSEHRMNWRATAQGAKQCMYV